MGAALEGADFGFDHRIKRSTGEVLWVRSQGQVIRSAAGVPLRMHGTVHNITESKRAEIALREAAARHRLLQIMAGAANSAGSIEEALHVAVHEICVYTGWSAGHAYLHSPLVGDGVTAVPIWHLADTELLAPLRAADWTGAGATVARRVVTTGAAQNRFGRHADRTAGALGTASGLGLEATFAFPVPVEGEVAAVLEFFCVDQVTLDETLMETIAQVGTQLARVVERQRASDNLAAARDAAMESSRLKSEFLATMSHEIRTPMNGVIGLTELLLGTDLDERQRHYAERVQGAGDSLLGIISDILDFSKIEAGKLDIEAVDVDLLAIVEQAADLVAEAAREKGLELQTHCHADLPARLRGDPARIRQVLINLASNAVKFTSGGEVTIRAGITGPRPDEDGRAPADNVMVRISVTDTGAGIPVADQERMFEPFTQADASTTRRFGGTGLGLAISRRLVTAMGGEIGVESSPGRGSTFWFTLALQRRPGRVEPTDSAHQSLTGLRVLVVDDNHTNQVILSERLGAWGLRPDCAADGWAALAQLHRAASDGDPYQIAVLDLRMQGMDGLQLAEKVSADSALATTRMILLTSASEPGAEIGRSAAISAWLTMPVRQSTLYDRLVRVMSMDPDRQQAAAVALAVVPAGRGHLLIVEDNAVNQVVARAMLVKLGYDCDLAANGLEALTTMATTDYAAVLMDCHMPTMDGYAATAEIRRREGMSRRTPIIAMTAGAVAGDRQRCLDAGMDDYIAKPVKTADLDLVIARWIGAASDADAAGQPEPAGS